MITVDAETKRIQQQATDPAASVWVSANAGSGKTYVLAKRVIRLLLSGTDPSAILCLTFTKAAAAEMATRVFETLGRWTTLDDAALDRELQEQDGSAVTAEARIRARRLFARALETPGGLKIQTIHAFCEKLLHQFPFEAEVAGAFSVMDDREAALAIETARREILALASADAHGPLGRAFARLLVVASDQGIETALDAVIERRAALAALIEREGSLEAGLAALRAALGLEGDVDAAAIEGQIVWGIPFRGADLSRLIDGLLAAGPAHRSLGEALAGLSSAGDDGARAALWLGYLLTGKGEPKALGTLAPKALLKAWPGLDEKLEAERQRIAHLLERQAALACLEATEALLTLGAAVTGRYDTAKRLAGKLDFSDLVERTAGLLSRSEAANWVHYKLDRGLDHILVDEAQDTSPRQWDVITGLADEFFAGKGQRDRMRTFFAVGDEKQSIYSFQGAVPAFFALQRARFRRAAEAAKARFAALELTLSFRSTADVLAAVDAVFAAPEAHRGLAREPQATVHEAARRGEPGRVTLWPPIAPEKAEEPAEWHQPLDRLDAESPENRLAARIAGTIAGWLAAGERIDATGEPIRPGGILILTRTRGAQTDAINRALKAAGLAVAGADRLKLGGHIAVMDLLALADAVLQPADDLALASLLKSPLMGLGEEDLCTLAHGRRSTLAAALAAAESPPARRAAERYALWRSRADFMGPHAFFARILGPDGGRRRLLARLGAEADEVLDEFLARALAFEDSEAPSLQGFVAWMRAAATEIKRDADIGRDEIRVMTVHGAKGLEADIVFLVDTGSAPGHASHQPKLASLADDPEAEAGAPLAFVTSGRRAGAVQAALDGIAERGREEYRRLLYVALTRARDRLIICGTVKAKPPAEPLWQDMVRSALAAEARPVEVTIGPESFEALEWRRAGAAPPAPPAERPAPPRRAAAPLPAFLGIPAPAAPASPRPLRPSAPAGAAAADAVLRGTIVHRLLQALPEHPAPQRPEVARAYIDAVAPDWPEAERADLSTALAALIADPAFAPLFGEGSRAEVSVTGTLPTVAGPLSVTGRIDRLVVTPARILIADFKTNRVVPERIGEAPADHVAQLALYRAVLQRLYRGRSVEAVLVYTAAPRLIAVPAALMDGHMSRITGA